MQVSIKFLGKEEEIFGKEEEKFSLVKFFLLKMNWSRRRGKLPFDVLQKSSQTRRGGVVSIKKCSNGVMDMQLYALRLSSAIYESLCALPRSTSI